MVFIEYKNCIDIIKLTRKIVWNKKVENMRSSRKRMDNFIIGMGKALDIGSTKRNIRIETNKKNDHQTLREDVEKVGKDMYEVINGNRQLIGK